MKRKHIFATAVAVFVVLVSLGVFGSNLPVVQYFGNALGVLLGFILGIWWQETERERIRNEQEAEKKQLYQARVERFWNEYKAFLLELESKVDRLKNQVTQREAIYDTIIELRLPLPEARHFERQVSELEIDKITRQEIEQIADEMKVLDEYMDFGTEKLRSWHENFRIRVNNLWSRIRKLNTEYSGKIAI